jgi:hypothetical protein
MKSAPKSTPQAARTLQRVTYWALPIGITLVVAALGVGMLPDSVGGDWLKRFRSSYQAESAVVIVPVQPQVLTGSLAAQPDRARPTLDSLAEAMAGEAGQTELKQQLARHQTTHAKAHPNATLDPAQVLSDPAYRIHWLPDEAHYALRIWVEGRQPEAVVALADAAAEAALHHYRATLAAQTPKTGSSPLDSFLTETLKQTEAKLHHTEAALAQLESPGDEAEGVVPMVSQAQLVSNLSQLVATAQAEVAAQQASTHQLMHQLGFSSQQEAHLSEVLTSDPLLKQAQAQLFDTQIRRQTLVSQLGADSPPVAEADKVLARLESTWTQRVQTLLAPPAEQPVAHQPGPSPALPKARTLAPQEMKRFVQLALSASQLKGQQARLSTLRQQLAATKKGSPAATHPAPVAQAIQREHLKREQRHLQREVELIQALLAAQKAQHPPMAETDGLSRFAQIKYRGRLIEQSALNPVWPTMALFSLFLVGVWTLRKERILPEQLMSPRGQTPWPEAMVAPPTVAEAAVPEDWDADLAAEATWDADFEEEEAEVADGVSEAAMPVASPVVSPQAPDPDMNPFERLETPFMSGPKVIQSLKSPVVKQQFHQLLDRLGWPHRLPRQVAVAQSPELAAALAVSMARSEGPVILVDCDLAWPRLHKLFEVDNTWGVSNLLADPSRVVDQVGPLTQQSALVIIPAGRVDSTVAATGAESLDAAVDALIEAGWPAVLHALESLGGRLVINLPPMADAGRMARLLSAGVGHGLIVCAHGSDQADPLRVLSSRTLQELGLAIDWVRRVYWKMFA